MMFASALILATFFSTTLTDDMDGSYVKYKHHRSWNLLPHEECGRRRPELSRSRRALGADDADLGQYPWMAALFFSNFSQYQNSPHCSGSLISARYILTAAHCCTYTDVELRETFNVKTIRLGEHTLSSNPDCMKKHCAPHPRWVDVESFIVHEQYDFHPDYPHHDICLIRLIRSIKKFNDYVRPICLPIYENLSTHINDGSMLEAAGWGVTESGRRADVLQTLRLPMMSPRECSRLIPSAEVGPGQLCAGGLAGQGTCSGDSGGPLMAPVLAITYVVGIDSCVHGDKATGPLCGAGTPTIFTRVSEYLPWIMDNIHE